MTKLCVARAWAKLRVRDTRIHLQQWENPGVDPNARWTPGHTGLAPHATVWVGDPTLPTDQQSLKGFRQPTVPFSRRCQPFLSSKRAGCCRSTAPTHRINYALPNSPKLSPTTKTGKSSNALPSSSNSPTSLPRWQPVPPLPCSTASWVDSFPQLHTRFPPSTVANRSFSWRSAQSVVTLLVLPKRNVAKSHLPWSWRAPQVQVAHNTLARLSFTPSSSTYRSSARRRSSLPRAVPFITILSRAFFSQCFLIFFSRFFPAVGPRSMLGLTSGAYGWGLGGLRAWSKRSLKPGQGHCCWWQWSWEGGGGSRWWPSWPRPPLRPTNWKSTLRLQLFGRGLAVEHCAGPAIWRMCPRTLLTIGFEATHN